MKIFAICLLLILSANVIAQPTEKSPSPKMSKEERDKAIKLLLDSNKQTLDAIEKLTEVQWNYKPAPEKWSVGEVAEHIWLAETLLFAATENALKTPENPNWIEQTKGKSERLEQILLNRTGKAQAPEQIKPTGKSRAEIINGIKEARAKTLKFIRETDAAMNSHTLDHPFKIFGTLNAYQWLIYIPLHNLRHNQQIEEVIASAGFPK